jgi:hypothetical protein
VAWYAPYFIAYTFVLARANEYQADRAAADLVGAPVVAAALNRVNVASPQYQAFIGETFNRIGDSPKPPADLAQRWATAAAAPADPAQRWLNEALDRPGQVADTHPVLRQRLAALAADTDAATLPPPRLQPSAAEAWLGGRLGFLREFFQARWVDQVARPWAERHEAIQGQRTRLAVLRAQAERSTDEDFERLRLVAALEPETDWRAEVAAFNATHADQAGALYLEGMLRLDRDDDQGLALLERAMALDAETIKPGCERAYAFCRAHKDEARAEAYAERWCQRDALEAERRRHAANLDPAHAVELATLDTETMARLRTRLAAVDHKGIAALYFVRRVLPVDPELLTYVLGIEMTWWARRRGQHRALVNRLAALEWPVHVIVCTLDGRYRRYADRLRAVTGARIG